MELLGDFKTSVIRALSEIDKNWENYEGLIICGTHSPKNPKELIEKIKKAREKSIPFYGECYGHQLACIEWARNIMGIKNATSEEFGQGQFVVKKRPEGLKVGLQEGESYWNNYEVDEDIEDDYFEYRPLSMFSAQYHASYQSSKDKPHPLLVKFLKYAKSKMAM